MALEVHQDGPGARGLHHAPHGLTGEAPPGQGQQQQGTETHLAAEVAPVGNAG